MLQTQNLFLSWDGTAWRQSPFSWDITLEEAKKEVSDQTNSFAYQLLTPNDWLVTRQVEEGIQVPAEWTAWRQSIRDLAREKIEKINSYSTKETLNDYVTGNEYLSWPDQP